MNTIKDASKADRILYNSANCKDIFDSSESKVGRIIKSQFFGQYVVHIFETAENEKIWEMFHFLKDAEKFASDPTVYTNKGGYAVAI